uniref:Uncharacterized protein n=1 Tax=Vibrio parahaemolyticus TaxID=670 RepID=A0A7M1WEU2_VIBPH|nr:hypothetical protein VP318_00014 [Vibrio parahaemolyticus]
MVTIHQTEVHATHNLLVRFSMNSKKLSSKELQDSTRSHWRVDALTVGLYSTRRRMLYSNR